jgi:hypothetical protein
MMKALTTETRHLHPICLANRAFGAVQVRHGEGSIQNLCDSARSVRGSQWVDHANPGS